jgi:hypothetical protein
MMRVGHDVGQAAAGTCTHACAYACVLLHGNCSCARVALPRTLLVYIEIHTRPRAHRAHIHV